MTKERLEGIKRELEEGLNSISLDFLGDHDLTDSSYLSADLSEDEENIKKLLVIRWLLKNDIFTLEEEELAELLDEAADYHNDRISDLLDLVNEKLGEEN